MHSRERILSTIHRQPADCVPCSPHVAVDTIERMPERNFWYDAHLRDEVMRLDLKAIEICDGMHPKEVVDECLRLLARDGEQ